MTARWRRAGPSSRCAAPGLGPIASASPVPAEFRLSVTAYPGIRPGDALETLIHELTHLHVGRAAEAHAWHGRTFKATLARAMEEAYGLSAPAPSSTRHGTYAEAIERERAVI